MDSLIRAANDLIIFDWQQKYIEDTFLRFVHSFADVICPIKDGLWKFTWYGNCSLKLVEMQCICYMLGAGALPSNILFDKEEDQA